MADDPVNHVLMDLLPGDMQFINNYHVLHGRTAYEDDRSAGHIRHLKRLWLETTVLTEPPAVLRQQPKPLVREANRQPPQGPLTLSTASVRSHVRMAAVGAHRWSGLVRTCGR